MHRVLLLACGATLALGCARSDITNLPDAGELPEAGLVDAGPPPPTFTDRVDILLVVDNTYNLDLAQDLLARSLPALFNRLVSPACVNGFGTVVATTESPTDPCPVGKREMAPVTDIHIGVISTSLGGHGADTCSPQSTGFKPQMNDASHLLSRKLGGGSVPTWADKGFLAWDPGATTDPPGDASAPEFLTKLDQMVRGVGVGGCGYESQLESIYRFLVDPAPYQDVIIDEENRAQPVGVDEIVLQQRADFLRPDSVVLVMLLTDENDCSVMDGGQFYLSLQIQKGGGFYHLPRPRSECLEDPYDPCCASCGQKTPEGCPPTEQNTACQIGPLTDAEDPVNLRCWDQKRRFGLDFKYPISRYTEGFSAEKVADRDGNVLDNPLLAGGRPPEWVFFSAIVGVPWQDLANDPKDLSKGYKQAETLAWDLMLGKPEKGVSPIDPLMIESVAPRTGTQPVTGAPIVGTDGEYLENGINGHERNIAFSDDLQYTCIFKRPAGKLCNTTTPECECQTGDIDTNPLCQLPDGSYTNIQQFAKAQPGTRQLELVREMGSQGIPASICAALTVGEDQPTYGYRPAIDATLRAIRKRLTPPEPTE